MKTSSAPAASASVRSASSMTHHSSSTSRVTPASGPDDSGGVTTSSPKTAEDVGAGALAHVPGGVEEDRLARARAGA